MKVTFGDKTFQYLQPKPFSRVNLLYLTNIKQDLYQIETFAEKTMAFGEVWLGALGFQLFSEARMEDMIGLDLPYVVQCQ